MRPLIWNVYRSAMTSDIDHRSLSGETREMRAERHADPFSLAAISRSCFKMRRLGEYVQARLLIPSVLHPVASVGIRECPRRSR
jgi:hypothetical protein